MTESEGVRAEKIERAEAIIGYRFKNRELIGAALTHPSAAQGLGVDANYERLEFLGDSLLGSIVAEQAYFAYPRAHEGKLTQIKMALVSGTMLSSVSAELGLEDVLILGSSELGTGGRGIHSALENVYESIVAALYLDGGIGAAFAFVKRTLLPMMNEHLSLQRQAPKSVLQEQLQELGQKPVYELISHQGPPHDRVFNVQVSVDGKVYGQGSGRSKKQAESAAAAAALKMLSARVADGDK